MKRVCRGGLKVSIRAWPKATLRNVFLFFNRTLVNFGF
jgi:hypothetical protein